MPFDPREFEAMLANLQQQPQPQMAPPTPPAPVLSSPVVPVDPTAALRRPATAMPPKGKVPPKRSVNALQANAQGRDADQEATDLLSQLFAPQQAQLEDMRKQKAKLEGTDSVGDYNPLLAFTDAWLGTNSAQKLKPRGLTDSEKQKRLAELTDKINDNEAGVAKQKVDLIKADKNQELGYDRLAHMYDRVLASQANGMSMGQSLRYENDMQKTLERFGDQLSGYHKSRNMMANLTNQQGRIASMRALLNGKDYNSLTNSQVAELAEGIVPIVTGTNSAAGSEARLNNFLQKNLKMSYADFMSYLTSQPQAAGQGKFVELLEDMLNREHKVRSQELNSERTRVLPTFARLYKDPKSREDFYQVAASRGMPQEEVDSHFDPKNRQKMAEEFHRSGGDVPGAGPMTTKGGTAIPGHMTKAFETARSNKNNDKYSDEDILNALMSAKKK
jgi:hypothetical protein